MIHKHTCSPHTHIQGKSRAWLAGTDLPLSSRNEELNDSLQPVLTLQSVAKQYTILYFWHAIRHRVRWGTRKKMAKCHAFEIWASVVFVAV